MTVSRLEKLAPLSGVLAAVLVLLGTYFFTWTFLPAPQEAAAIFGDNTRMTLSIVFGAPSTFMFFWFAGSVYHTLRERETGTGRLSILAYGGGLIVAASVGLSFAILMAGMSRAGSAAGIDPFVAALLYDLWGLTMWSMVSFSFVIFIAATTLASQRYSIMPGWFNWFSWLIVIGLVSPVYWAVVVLAVAWVFILSLMLYQRGR